MESNAFSTTGIVGNACADKLFVSLLMEIEKRGIDFHKEFTIAEIAGLIPKGTAGVDNNSTYGFSIMSMFSDQKGRDYFIFNNVDLRNEFAAICRNNRNRDNYYWLKRYPNEKVRINPKYIKG